ncbi:hypothetical protein ASG11_01125 [Sphingomonas sp. Leaf357]|nr:hypothetical protein ASG11_01125 [Sphingomonas sp. Leaf357]
MSLPRLLQHIAALNNLLVATALHLAFKSQPEQSPPDTGCLSANGGRGILYPPTADAGRAIAM